MMRAEPLSPVRSFFKLAVCVLALSGCSSMSGSLPDVAFAWSQADDRLQAVPALKPDISPASPAAFLREDDPFLPLAPRPDAPNGKEWRELGRVDKGPTIVGLNLSMDLATHDWTTRAGLVRRGGKRGFSPQVVMSFDGP